MHNVTESEVRQFIERLDTLAEDCVNARADLANAVAAVKSAKETLRAAEALVLSAGVEGKNAEERKNATELLLTTAPQVTMSKTELAGAEYALDLIEISVSDATDRFSAARHAADLLGNWLRSTAK